MNILITGVTGFIGSNCVAPILNDEFNVLKKSNKLPCKVFALVREQSKNNKNIVSLQQQFSRDRFQVIIGDFVDLLQDDQTQCILNLREIIESNEINVIIHLAAKMDFYPQERESIIKTNVIGVKNLLKSSLDVNNNNRPFIKRFIYASSTEAMGGREQHTPPIPLSELDDESSKPDFLYGETKREAEALVRKYDQKYHLDSIILRFTGVFGKNDDFSIFELIQGVSYGVLCIIPAFPIGYLMFTHIDDIVQSVVLAIVKVKDPNQDDTKSLIPYTYIIAPSKGMTYREALIFLNDKLGRQKFNIPLSLPICSKLFSLVGKVFYRFRHKQFIFKSYTLTQMTRDRIFSNQRAKSELGFRPKYNFKSGLNETVEDYIRTDRIPYFKISPVFIFILVFILVLTFLVKTLLS